MKMIQYAKTMLTFLHSNKGNGYTCKQLRKSTGVPMKFIGRALQNTEAVAVKVRVGGRARMHYAISF